MTNKEIKDEALKRLKGKWGDSIAYTVFSMAGVLVIVLLELLLYCFYKKLDVGDFYSKEFLLGTAFGKLFIFIRVVVWFVIIMPELSIFRRLFVDVVDGKNYIVTKQYIRRTFWKNMVKSTYNSLITTMLKIFVAIPLGIGVYGIYFWGYVSKLNELTSWGLFCFMLSLGFSVVWLGFLIYYCISLSLTSYIMILNPRANIFDACDLSVKLMDGKHEKYIRFMLSFVKFIPLLIFIYPIFLITPYFFVSYTLLVEDIMKDYWQDKLPAMIQRWKKHVG